MASAASPEKMEAVVFVRHMGRSPTTRTKRAARAGHRRQGVVLCNGLRIRKKNRLRPTKVALKLLAQDWEHVLELVRVGTLEICEPGGKAVPYEQLKTFLTGGAAPPSPPPLPTPAPKATQESPPADPKGYTEEELEKKTRNELNEIAKEFGVASPHKLPSKPAVIEAIFAASTGGE